MNVLKSIAVIIVLSVWTACSSDKTQTAETPADETASVPLVSGKYKIKSGTIHFETSMGTFKNKKIVYFDDYGAKERVEEYTDDEPLKGYNTSDGKIRYYIDLTDKSAWIVDEHGGRGWEMQFHTWEEIERQGNRDNKFKRVDNITVAGKDCEAYAYNDQAIFAGWQGLTLYHKQQPNILMEAVKLEENVTHDPGFFAVPSGFKVKERPSY